jgi:ADP-ribosylglycohydrolase
MSALDLQDRIHGALCLAGMGDALGAPTEQWGIDEILATHGGLVTHFVAPTPDTFAGALGGLRGEVTDDTSQMVYLARALVAGNGRLDTQAWVACLLDWAATSPKAAFMGPSTLGIVRALQAGQDISRVGTIGQSTRKLTTMGNTNGAAMRVAPCGLVNPGRLREACELACTTCLPAHDTDVAMASACTIAAACARAVDGAALPAVLDAALEGALLSEQLGRERARHVPGPRLPVRLQMALAIAAAPHANDSAFLHAMASQVGTSVLAAESVPAALGVLAYAKADPLRTISLAASIGNDTDTMATMAGAIAGAMSGTAGLPQDLLREFQAVNEALYQLGPLAAALAACAGVTAS